jgi:hypothetical protein
VLREVGFTASWERGPSAKLGNFSTHHIHAVLSGCSHVSSGAKDQIAQVRNGQNGLANHAADYGPKVPYITWRQAFKKYVSTPASAPVPAPAPTASQEDLAVAIQQQMHRSKPQVVKPTKGNARKVLYLKDNGSVSWAFGAGKYEVIAYVRIQGIGANDELPIQVGIIDTDSTGKAVHSQYLGQVGLPGGSGISYRQYVWRGNVAAPAKGRTRRLRFVARNYSGRNVTVSEIYTYVWKAPIA